MGLEMVNSPCSSGKTKFEKDPIMDPFKLKCRQAFNGPQDFEVDGFLEFRYNEMTLRGSMTFRYNHIVDNFKQELSISFPYVESFTLVEPNLLEGVCGALIVVLTEKCASKMLPSFGSKEFISEKMKHENDSSMTRFLFVLEPITDLEHFFEANSADETRKLFPFCELEHRFDWVVKSRSLDTKRGIHNTNINVFEKCTAEGFVKYLERNLLKVIPYDQAIGANYAYQPPMKKVSDICLHPKDEYYKKEKRFKNNAGEQNGTYDENVFYELNDNRSDYIQNDFKRKVAFYKKHVGFEDPATNENILDNMKASVTPTVRTYGNDCQKPSQHNFTSSQSTPSTSETARKSTRRKILTISLSDDDEGGDDKSSSSNCSLEPPEKKMKFTGNTSLIRFPSSGSNFVEVQFDDVRVLAHGEMLNDTIVEFYIRYIVHRLLKKTDISKIHIFNTFFFQKLTDRQPAHVFGKSERAGSVRYAWIKNNYKLVKSWTKKANIFEKDYIIVPVNDDLHWYVVIIAKPALAVLSTEGDTSQSRKRGATCANPKSHLIVLDSLRDSADIKRRCVIDIIRDYLECELEDKKTIPGFFNRRLLGAVHPRGLPRQQNYVDCGLYLLGFVEAFMTKPMSPQQLSDPTENWYSWYPHFNVKMKFMREKVLRFILKLAGPEKVEQLKAYELSQGRGATVPTMEGIVDEGRRPRRHTMTGYFESTKHSSFQSRCPSEPPDLKNFPPPAGMTVPKN